MLMEMRVRFSSPQNISGASQYDSDAAFSSTTEVDGENIIGSIQLNPISQNDPNDGLHGLHGAILCLCLSFF